MAQWQEEVLLLHVEMQRVLMSLAVHADHQKQWKPWDTDDLLTRGLHAYTLHQADISGGQGRWFWSVLQLGSLLVLHSVLSKLKLSVIGWFSFQA